MYSTKLEPVDIYIYMNENTSPNLQDLQAKGRVLRKALENSRKTTGTVCYVIKIWETL